MKNTLLGCLVLTLLALQASSGNGQEKPLKKALPQAPTATVEKGPFKVEVNLQGVIEAEAMTPIRFSPEAWTTQTGGPLMVLKAVEPGTTVRKGDPLIWLDLDRVNQVIRDLEAEAKLTELALHLAEKELPIQEQTTPRDLSTAERARKLSEEDLQEFLQNGRVFAEQNAEFRLKGYRNNYENAKEELQQLEKMYKANDLTEESEQIVLRRYRNLVEMYAFLLKSAEKNRHDTLKFELPRQERGLHERAEQTALALEKARATLPLLLDQKRLTLAKLRYEKDKSADRLAKLHKDRDAGIARSPVTGIVYYGKCQLGQWPTAAAMADKLQRGGQVQPEETLMTIVQPMGLFVRAEVEEKDLHLVLLMSGQETKTIPVGFPDIKLKSRIESVSAVPQKPGKYPARIALDRVTADKPLMPGMACTIKLVPYRKADALTVPAAAVFPDDLDEDQHHVWLPGVEPTRRVVRIGRKSGDRVEILEGLTAGEAILLQKPAEGKPLSGKEASS